jgi:hypothetical protein
MKERAMHDKVNEIPGNNHFFSYQVIVGPGAYVGQQIIKLEQKIDSKPNNIFITKV